MRPGAWRPRNVRYGGTTPWLEAGAESNGSWTRHLAPARGPPIRVAAGARRSSEGIVANRAVEQAWSVGSERSGRQAGLPRRGTGAVVRETARRVERTMRRGGVAERGGRQVGLSRRATGTTVQAAGRRVEQLARRGGVAERGGKQVELPGRGTGTTVQRAERRVKRAGRRSRRVAERGGNQGGPLRHGDPGCRTEGAASVT
jgi:hypothetical protein